MRYGRWSAGPPFGALAATMLLMTAYGQVRGQADAPPEIPPVAVAHELGPLFVRVEAPRGVVALSDVAEMNVTVRAPERVQTQLDAQVGQNIGSWTLLAIRKDGPDELDGRFGTLLLTRWKLTLEPATEGDLSGSAPLRYRQLGEDEWESVVAQFPTVKAAAQFVADPQATSLRPLPTLETAVESRPIWPRLLRWTGATLAVIVAGAVVISVWKGKRESESQIAIRRLKEASIEPIEDYRAAIFETTQIVREYVERTYSLPVTHQTTPEFLNDPATRSKLSEDQRLALHDFLEACDVDRFGGREPGRDDWLRSNQRAKSFLVGEQA